MGYRGYRPHGQWGHRWYGVWAMGTGGNGYRGYYKSSVTHCPCGPYPLYSIPPVPLCPCGPHWPCAPYPLYPITPCVHIAHSPHCPYGPYPLYPIAPITNITHYPMGDSSDGQHGQSGTWGNNVQGVWVQGV